MTSINNLEIKMIAEIVPDHYRIDFNYSGDSLAFLPGQFVEVYLPNKGEGHLFPRPFGFYEAGLNEFSILFKVRGFGTKLLSLMSTGGKLQMLLPLGNCFPEYAENICLLAGGIGIVPLHFWVDYWSRSGKDLSKVKFYYGVSNSSHFIDVDYLRAKGCSVVLSTDDGSLGAKGSCLDVLKKDIERDEFFPQAIMACGPDRMLNSIASFALEKGIPASVSLEEKMGCGFGACMGCAVKGKSISGEEIHYKMVCKDGPVFDVKDLDWEH